MNVFTVNYSVGKIGDRHGFRFRPDYKREEYRRRNPSQSPFFPPPGLITNGKNIAGEIRASPHFSRKYCDPDNLVVSIYGPVNEQNSSLIGNIEE